MPTQEVTPFSLLHWDRRFTVPDFQRPFSWGSDEVREFWDDLGPVLSGSQPELFLGTIVLEIGQPGRAMIWDGQQRIATLVMFLAACRDRLLSAPSATDPGLAAEINSMILGGSLAPTRSPAITMGTIDDRTFREFALLPVGDANKKDENFWRGLPVRARRADWSPRVVEVFESIRRLVADYSQSAAKQLGSEREALKHLSTALLHKIRVVRFETVSEEEAFRLFEVLNDRGLELSAADLIKNFLLSRAAPGSKLRADMKSDWDALTRTVGTGRLTGYLRHFYMSRFGRTTKGDLYDRVVDLCSGRLGTPVPVDSFLSDALDAADLYARAIGVSQGGWSSARLAESIDSLNRISATQWTPLLLAAHAVGLGDPALEEITRAVESLFVRSVIVGGRNPNSLERLFGDAATNLWKSVKQSNPPSTPADGLRIALETVRKATPSDAEFKERFSELRDLSTQTAKLLLEKLERRAQTEAKGGVVPQLSILDMEHIYPRTDGPDWPVQGAPGHVPTDDRELIGNLTLLHLARNRQQKNHGFSKKKQVYASSPLEITSLIASYSKWDIDSIKDRQLKLADIATRTWAAS